MKQSTLIIIFSIVLILLIFLAGWTGYNLNKCPPQIDSPIIIKEKIDTSKWVSAAKLYKDSMEFYKKKSKINFNPKKDTIYEKIPYSALRDSVYKQFGTIEIEL